MKNPTFFKRRHLATAIGSALLPALATQSVLAQQLEEVVVTATKRAESTQDIAVSVTAQKAFKTSQLLSKPSHRIDWNNWAFRILRITSFNYPASQLAAADPGRILFISAG